MRIFIVLSVFCISHFVVKGQVGTINQLDNNSQKDGRWIVYYDVNGKEVIDSAKAVYFRYTWYEHGTNIYPFQWRSQADRIVSSGESDRNAGIKPLHGEYRIVAKKGYVKSIHVFDEGEYVSYRNFYRDGKLHEYCNFENLHFEQGEFEPHTYYKRSYNKKAEVTCYYMGCHPNYKDPGGDSLWRFERSYFDSTALTILKIVGDSTFAKVTKYRDNQAIRSVDQIIIKGQQPIAHGSATFWYNNGQKKEEGHYEFNKRVGEWKQWGIDGTEIKSEVDFAQLNKTNSAGEKTGWWITYLDKNLKVQEDSIGATHCMYNYYSGKFYHYRYGNGLGSKNKPVQCPKSDSLKLGNFNLLNGDYVTYYKNGNIQSLLVAENGILKEFKNYFPDGQLHVHCIYSPECGAPIRLCIKQYDKSGNLTYDGAGLVPQDYKKEYR